jgi:hypothetical protein
MLRQVDLLAHSNRHFTDPLFLESAVFAPRDNLPCDNGANDGA